MTTRRRTAPRVGLFGLLGSGNIGNDGSLEAVLDYLADRHPDATVDFLCAGAEEITARYGLPATALHWYQRHENRQGTLSTFALKITGKVFDAFRTAAWVRRHDVVIVPGMGVLEATLPLRPWGFPYALFLLCASGRLFGTKVALVSVGANVMRQRLTRRLFTTAAALAHYRSFRDAQSRDALRAMGLDTSADSVYPDLVFSLPTPPESANCSGTVGVGVMAYFGGNDDRPHAEQIYRDYLATMARFVQWLLDNGRRVRLFTGDQVDDSVVAHILADLAERRPDLPPARVVANPVRSLTELMREMAAVDSVVAIRYHNVLCALKLAKPTVSIGYARKNDVLMADMGLAEYCQHARSLDSDLLIDQFTALESRRAEVRQVLAARASANRMLLDDQFADLSAALFSATGRPATRAAGRSR